MRIFNKFCRFSVKKTLGRSFKEFMNNSSIGHQTIFLLKIKINPDTIKVNFSFFSLIQKCFLNVFEKKLYKCITLLCQLILCDKTNRKNYNISLKSIFLLNEKNILQEKKVFLFAQNVFIRLPYTNFTNLRNLRKILFKRFSFKIWP